MNHPTTLSFWERESFFKNIDVAIIGSGIVGLSAALSLRARAPKLSIAVIERGALPEGASTRNAGFACFGSVTELLDDLKNMTENAVFTLVEQRFKGLERLRKRVGDKNLRYEAFGGYEIFKNTEGSVFKECSDILPYFNKHLAAITGKKATYQVSTSDFGFQKTLPQMIHNTAEGQLNTGEMMRTLLTLARKNGINIFNGLKIDTLSENTEGVTLWTSEGWAFQAKHVIVATNGFARQLMPDLPVEAVRNQVLVTKPIANLKLKGSFHYDKGYIYFRNIGNRLLIGGGRNRDFQTETTAAFGVTDNIQNSLNMLLKTTILPQQMIEIDSMWSGILGVGSVKKPIIERLSRHIIVAVRMGGMGVAIGSLVGEEAANLIDL